ncbi:type II toxin-antitoxin system PemK/MazF family toxin [Georgenia muralis]|uniref:type II toxin-antitoxin system PemK/MazF family toxin n=1 Tax=Georgenia muralis TaxID=154117 RepID=UPI001FE5D093|nr:type II toxin-antitoxin system PemK/MazF family toxin [Georgenia muralis]
MPIASNTERIFPFQTFLPAASTGLRHDSKAQAEQVRPISVERLGALLGRAPADVMASLDDAPRLHLRL